MKFAIGETVKISKNNSLFFDATGKFATVEHVNEYDSQISITSIVRRLKQESTIEIWKREYSLLKKIFWKE